MRPRTTVRQFVRACQFDSLLKLSQLRRSVTPWQLVTASTFLAWTTLLTTPALAQQRSFPQQQSVLQQQAAHQQSPSFQAGQPNGPMIPGSDRLVRGQSDPVGGSGNAQRGASPFPSDGYRNEWNAAHPGSQTQPATKGVHSNAVVPASAQQTVPPDSGVAASVNAADAGGQQNGTPLDLSSADEHTPAKGSSSVFGAVVSIGSSFVIVMALFLGVAWFYRKTMSTTMGSSLPKQVVEVLGRSSIAARQQLVLVRFGSKLVLVSMIQGEARTISEITDPLEVDKLTGECESAKPGSSVQSFKSVFAQGVRAS